MGNEQETRRDVCGRGLARTRSSRVASNAPPSPATTVPSAGGLAPFNTRTTSPTSSNSASTRSTFVPGFDAKLCSSADASPFSGSSLCVPAAVWPDVERESAMALSGREVVGTRTSAVVGRSFPRAVIASAVRPLLNASRKRPGTQFAASVSCVSPHCYVLLTCK